MGHNLESLSDPQLQEWLRPRGVIWAGEWQARLTRKRALSLSRK